MPTLLRTAALKPEMSILGDDEEPDVSGDWQTVVVHGQRIGIRTAILEEKVSPWIESHRSLRTDVSDVHPG